MYESRGTGKGGALTGSEKEEHMTRDEALMRVRERAGGDLSRVPGPVIMRAVELEMQEEGEVR